MKASHGLWQYSQFNFATKATLLIFIKAIHKTILFNLLILINPPLSGPNLHSHRLFSRIILLPNEHGLVSNQEKQKSLLFQTEKDVILGGCCRDTGRAQGDYRRYQ